MTIFHSCSRLPESSVPPTGRAPPGLFTQNCRRDAPAGGDALCWLRTVKTTPALGARPLRSYVSAALVFRAKACPQTIQHIPHRRTSPRQFLFLKGFLHLLHKALLFLLLSFIALSGIIVLMQGIPCQLVKPSQGLFRLSTQSLRCLDDQSDIMVSS